MLKIFKYLKKNEWMLVVCSLAFIVVQVWLDLKLPDYMAEITTKLQTEGTPVSELLIPGSYMLFCAVGSMIASIIVGYFAAKVAAGLAMRLRAMVFDKTLSFSMEEMNNFSTASLITRSTNDVTQIQTVVALGLQVIIKAPILAVWAIVKIADKNWQWTASTGAAVAALILMLSVIVVFALPSFQRIQRLTDNLNRVTREHLIGLRVVRAYNADQYQQEKFEQANVELTNTNLFANRLMTMIGPGMTFIMSGLSVSIYWIGAYLINGAAVPDRITLFSNMVVFSSYAMQVVMAFMMVSMIFILMPRASISAKRIMEVLNTESSIVNGHETTGEESVMGQVEFRNVSFKYPDAEEAVLRNISFTAKRGETVAFIGATGSGKTSVINLIPRFYDVTEGEVLVDGVNVRNYNQQALHNKIGYVPQRAVLFNGTVVSNVSYGDNGRAGASEKLVKEAVGIAQGTEFVEKMDGQYQGRISQGGANVSGGQKQRLSIARAIYRQPEIYIFDDSFSALDYRTDRILRSALKKETGHATTLIVGQRIGTIKDADRIIVLDQGEIVGSGTHEELMTNCSTYQEIAYSQLSKEELIHG
ncbi:MULTISPECIES: ABC transporter ATP-binding protein [Paenibacillus]|jgi:ATP-binding cassette subfamily B protein|uniref:ABC transporter ATP-binding protein n=3 Tax=Paenibacillus TaxID=44249 RepID=A0AAJ3J4R6_PAEPO|nr:MULTISPECIES: ABC transporter ATP-binding protein [Paenibacillus]AIW39985.1 multidrug ABC transporter ATP-binding protein [Paenibacillus polymyxa CR1]ALA42292.1 multidrug ABC transporter ATP-binding protein [Paenibacillus peoriae]APB75984.1 ABC transporter ATP-binding protein [Paenibacillus polymyxa]APQ59475.1 multidrug ABC transporter ATP-binding protein [Paenibacillus polymyxa]MCP3747687.1 ABC transporter ATP-binding protein/permease [Paenibacillus sp. A3M_27_13]